jgi:hypothetical protein
MYPSENDHPFKVRDTRNQFVQDNYKFVEAENQPKEYEFNHKKPFFKTTYRKSFSPPKVQALRTHNNKVVTFGRHMDNYGHGLGPYRDTRGIIV